MPKSAKLIKLCNSVYSPYQASKIMIFLLSIAVKYYWFSLVPFLVTFHIPFKRLTILTKSVLDIASRRASRPITISLYFSNLDCLRNLAQHGLGHGRRAYTSQTSVAFRLVQSSIVRTDVTKSFALGQKGSRVVIGAKI